MLELNSKHQLLVHADDINMLGENLQTVRENIESTVVEQVVACALVMQRARVRFPVGTGFLGEVFSGFFLTCKTNVRKL